MGFDWSVGVSVGYVQEVGYSWPPSRFSTRCLKMANPVPRPGTKKKPKTRNKLPGEDLPTPPPGETFESCPFSDTEDEVEAMRPEHRELYEKIKEYMKGDHEIHDDDGMNFYNYGDLADADADVNMAFKAAVEHLYPGQGKDFAIEMEHFGGAYEEVGEGASDAIAYLVYGTRTTAGGSIDMGIGNVNVPWGHKVTSIPTLDAETAKQVDAVFAVLVDRLGLKPKGPPGMALITTSSGG